MTRLHDPDRLSWTCSTPGWRRWGTARGSRSRSARPREPASSSTGPWSGCTASPASRRTSSSSRWAACARSSAATAALGTPRRYASSTTSTPSRPRGRAATRTGCGALAVMTEEWQSEPRPVRGRPDRDAVEVGVFWSIGAC
ncbi:hypothetical protein B6R96_03320 [Streptomyces sp. Sge12]|nr:hypothetical protein B6R96_03320 [Streptomyces sp. Sge12]